MFFERSIGFGVQSVKDEQPPSLCSYYILMRGVLLEILTVLFTFYRLTEVKQMEGREATQENCAENAFKGANANMWTVKMKWLQAGGTRCDAHSTLLTWRHHCPITAYVHKPYVFKLEVNVVLSVPSCGDGGFLHFYVCCVAFVSRLLLKPRHRRQWYFINKSSGSSCPDLIKRAVTFPSPDAAVVPSRQSTSHLCTAIYLYLDDSRANYMQTLQHTDSCQNRFSVIWTASRHECVEQFSQQRSTRMVISPLTSMS